MVASALSPDEGLAVFTELQKARRCFVLENELHTVYLVGYYLISMLSFSLLLQSISGFLNSSTTCIGMSQFPDGSAYLHSIASLTLSLALKGKQLPVYHPGR